MPDACVLRATGSRYAEPTPSAAAFGMATEAAPRGRAEGGRVRPTGASWLTRQSRQEPRTPTTTASGYGEGPQAADQEASGVPRDCLVAAAMPASASDATDGGSDMQGLHMTEWRCASRRQSSNVEICPGSSCARLQAGKLARRGTEG